MDPSTRLSSDPSPAAPVPPPDAYALVASTEEGPQDGSRFAEVRVDIVDRSGITVRHGPVSGLELELVRPEGEGGELEVRGRARRRARGGVALFRRLEWTAPGTYRLGFRALDADNLALSSPTSNWVQMSVAAEVFQRSAAVPAAIILGIQPVTLLFQGPFPQEVRVGRPVAPALRVAIYSAVGERVHAGVHSVAQVRIRAVPALPLCNHTVHAFQGVAEFSRLEVLPEHFAAGEDGTPRPGQSYHWEAWCAMDVETMIGPSKTSMLVRSPPFRLQEEAPSR